MVTRQLPLTSGVDRIVVAMQFGVSITHHDHEYVERRGGHAFLSHLRGAEGRARYRETALRRAEKMFENTLAGAGTPEQVCGAGLIVLQRAVLASEDLAVLLHALAEDHPEAGADHASTFGEDIWRRLTGVTIPDQVAVFVAIVRDPSIGLRAFRLPSDEVLAREQLTDDARKAASHLRDRTARRWGRMLVRVAGFWLNYGNAAKSTMHGFAAIAGRQITEPPGAGFLGRGVRVPDGPFVVMVNSTVRGDEVQTPQLVVPLDQARVSDFRRAGSLAVKLTHELCETLAGGIEGGYAYGIPFRLAHRLSAAEQQALPDAEPPQAEGTEWEDGGSA